MDTWKRLVQYWKDCGVGIRSGATQDGIRAFESKYSLIIPPDLRGYFETVDGMDDEMDSALNRFWPLSMVKLVSEELTEVHPDRWAYPDCYIFADHCIWCFAFGVKLGTGFHRCSGPVFSVVGGLPAGKQVAESFTAFVEMYLQDPRSVIIAA